jgi:hypothetical protein
MINPAWPEIAKATPANLHHSVGHGYVIAVATAHANLLMRVHRSSSKRTI